MDAAVSLTSLAADPVAAIPLAATPFAAIPFAVFPSPTQGVWHLAGVPIRAYALCIVLGIVVACLVTEIRMRRRGASPYLVLDIAVWAVPFGIVGARIYHVLTSPSQYFGADGDLVDIFKIWEGGLGIWGAVAGGAVGAWIACRRLGIPLRFLADALAPGLPLAQAIGRWGNWFNNELYGRKTSLPWGLKIYEWDSGTGRARTAVTESGASEAIVKGVYQPTFLYESLWDVGVAVLVWLLDRRYRFGRGRAFALYVMAYCVGRFWIEAMRSDAAGYFLGMRLNNWTAILVFLGGLAYFVLVRGPQERLRIAEDGTIAVVPAVGESLETAAGESLETAAASGEPSDIQGEASDNGHRDHADAAPPGEVVAGAADDAAGAADGTGEEVADAGGTSGGTGNGARKTGDGTDGSDGSDGTEAAYVRPSLDT